MDKSQRMIELRGYLHDVHGRVGDPGWHRAADDREDRNVFALSMLGLFLAITFVLPLVL